VLSASPKPCPHIHEGLGESIRERVVVVGAWRDPQPPPIAVVGIFIGNS
jgi:hypothetical protein